MFVDFYLVWFLTRHILFLFPSAVILEKTIRMPRSVSVKAASMLKGFLNKVTDSALSVVPLVIVQNSARAVFRHGSLKGIPSKEALRALLLCMEYF